MAHFAELDDNNVVTRVIVIHNNELLDENGNESEQKGINFCVAHYGGRWIQTSYNRNFRKNYAGVGFLYDSIRDAFIPPRPPDTFVLPDGTIYTSKGWVLNEDTCQWEELTE